MSSYKRIDAVKISVNILRYLSDQKEPVSGKDVAAAIDIPHGTAMCHLATLEDERLVRCVGGAWECDMGMSHFWARRKSLLEGRIMRDVNELKNMGA